MLLFRFLLTYWATAQTNVSGNLTGSIVWTIDKSPYVITSNSILASNAVLTIEPGVTIKFNSNVSMQINGTLIARGNESSKITFTSNTTMQPGAWGYLLFNPSSVDAIYDAITDTYLSGSILEHCIIEYAGSSTVLNNGALRLDDAHPFINYCTLRNNKITAICAYNLSSTLMISNSLFEKNKGGDYGGGGISLSGGYVFILGNTFSNNAAESGSGGAITVNLALNTLVVENNLFYSNTAFGTAALHANSSNNNIVTNIRYNVFVDNISLAQTSALWADPEASIYGNIMIRNSSVWNGTAYGGLNFRNNILAENTNTNDNGGYVSFANGVITCEKNQFISNIAPNYPALTVSQYNKMHLRYNTFAHNLALNKTTPTNAAIEIKRGYPMFEYNNFIKNNTGMDVYNNKAESEIATEAANNFWGIVDDNKIQERIFDWFDDATLGLFNYAPFLLELDTVAPMSPPLGVEKSNLGGGQVLVKWNKNKEKDTKGYKVHFGGFDLYRFKKFQDVGLDTFLLIDAHVTDSIAVTAYDAGYYEDADIISTFVNENMIEGHESWYAYAKDVLNCNVSIPNATDTVLFQPGQAKLVASAGKFYKWYDAKVRGNLLASGQVFITPYLSATDTFWLSNTDICESVRVPAVVKVLNTTTGLVAHYPFNANANDESGYGRHGIVNGAQLVSDRYGMEKGAYQFNGLDNYISLDNTSMLNLFNGFTLSAWVNFTSNDGGHSIVSKHENGSNNGFNLVATGNRAGVYTDVANHSAFSDSTYNDGKWHQYVATFNGKIISIYVDGVLQSSSDAQYTTGNNMEIRIGSDSHMSYFNGLIDDVSIYERPLNMEEIAMLYLPADSIQKLPMSLSVSTNNATCGKFNGSATVKVLGGKAPYQYKWSNGDISAFADTLSAGVFQVNVIDADGKTAFLNVSISNDNGPVISDFSVKHNNCFGLNQGSISVTVNGNAPLVYNWSSGQKTSSISGLAAGIYELLVTDANSCKTSAMYQVFQPEKLTANISSIPSHCSQNNGAISMTVFGGTSPYQYLWNNGMKGSSIDSLGAGLYNVEISDTNNCKLVLAVAVPSYDGPVIEVDEVENTDCKGMGSVSASVYLGVKPYAYQWSNGDTTLHLKNISSGTYTLTVTDANNCKAVASATVQAVLPVVPQICMVTVDTATGTNLIVWERASSQGISHYNLYREGSKRNSYLKIGSVLFNDLSVFTDSAANPRYHGWRYKLTAVDSCGNETAMSDPHRSMHVVVNVGQNSEVNLAWDKYEGFDFESYYISRYSKQGGYELIDSIAEGYTSITFLGQTNINSWKYFVSIFSPQQCRPSLLKIKEGPYLSSISNLEDNRLKSESEIKLPENDMSVIMIYPNPAHDYLTIVPKSIACLSVKAYNSSGKLIHEEQKLGNGRVTLNISTWERGLYLLFFENDGYSYTYKLVKE